MHIFKILIKYFYLFFLVFFSKWLSVLKHCSKIGEPSCGKIGEPSRLFIKIGENIAWIFNIQIFKYLNIFFLFLFNKIFKVSNLSNSNILFGILIEDLKKKDDKSLLYENLLILKIYSFFTMLNQTPENLLCFKYRKFSDFLKLNHLKVIGAEAEKLKNNISKADLKLSNLENNIKQDVLLQNISNKDILNYKTDISRKQILSVNEINNNNIKDLSFDKVNKEQTNVLFSEKDSSFDEDAYIQDYLNHINLFRTRKKKVKLSHIKKIKSGNKFVANYYFKDREPELDFILNIKKHFKDSFIDKNNLSYRKNMDQTLKRPIVRKLYNLDTQNVVGLTSFNQNVGFFNSNITETESWENLVDIPKDSVNLGFFYVINPFLVLGVILYSFFELFLFCYFLSFITGNPLDIIILIIKYPSAYYFNNLTVFPEISFVMNSLGIWFLILIVFFVKLYEIFEEPDYNGGIESSFITVVLSYFSYSFFLLFLIANVLESIHELNFFLTRYIFIGSPGYPNVFLILFHLIYDLIKLLSSFEYFYDTINSRSSIINTQFNFPSFQEYVLLKHRIPFVFYSDLEYFFNLNKSIKISNIYRYLLINLENWLLDSKNIVKHLEERNIWQNELLQDFRKYNYLKQKYNELVLVGQFYDRGFNGKNYRLDFQHMNSPIIANENNLYFDWRFTNNSLEGFVETNDRETNDKEINDREYYGYGSREFNGSYNKLMPTIKFASYSSLLEKKTEKISFKFNYFLNFFNTGFLNNLHNSDYSIKFFSFDYITYNNQNLSNFFGDFFYSFNRNILYKNELLFPYESIKNIPTGAGDIYINRRNPIVIYEKLFPDINAYKYNYKLVPIELLIPIGSNDKNIIRNRDPYFHEKVFTEKRVDLGKKKLLKVFGSCYLLDSKIQNFFSLMNIFSNQYHHFFFKRSFKTYGSGICFKNIDVNSNNKLSSYKAFLEKGTLYQNRIGHYLLDNISWAQYKFKWLLYPNSSYRRTDSFVLRPKYEDKRFYFDSLLKFYQVNFFRWKNSSQHNNWSLLQFKNFFINIFFFKQQRLKNVLDLKNFIETSKAKEMKFPDNLKFIPVVNKKDLIFLKQIIDLRRFDNLYNFSFNDCIEYFNLKSSVNVKNSNQKNNINYLMSFFAPIEYRNQLMLSKIKNDSIRFSIFFPNNGFNYRLFDTQDLKYFSEQGKDFFNLNSEIQKISSIQHPKKSRDSNSTDYVRKNKLHNLVENLVKRSDGWSKFNRVLTYNSDNLFSSSYKKISDKPSKLEKGKVKKEYNHNNVIQFSFGLEGIGKMPLLFRNYMNLLFLKNKIESFKYCKISFIKLQLMSMYGFTNFYANQEKNFFWSFFFKKNNRFNIISNLSNNNFLYQNQIEYNSVLYHKSFGYIFNTYNNDNIINLTNQYSYFKKFFVFYNFKHFFFFFDDFLFFDFLNKIRLKKEMNIISYNFYSHLSRGFHLKQKLIPYNKSSIQHSKNRFFFNKSSFSFFDIFSYISEFLLFSKVNKGDKFDKIRANLEEKITYNTAVLNNDLEKIMEFRLNSNIYEYKNNSQDVCEYYNNLINPKPEFNNSLLRESESIKRILKVEENLQSEDSFLKQVLVRPIDSKPTWYSKTQKYILAKFDRYPKDEQYILTNEDKSNLKSDFSKIAYLNSEEEFKDIIRNSELNYASLHHAVFFGNDMQYLEVMENDSKITYTIEQYRTKYYPYIGKSLFRYFFFYNYKGKQPSLYLTVKDSELLKHFVSLIESYSKDKNTSNNLNQIEIISEEKEEIRIQELKKFLLDNVLSNNQIILENNINQIPKYVIFEKFAILLDVLSSIITYDFIFEADSEFSIRKEFLKQFQDCLKGLESVLIDEIDKNNMGDILVNEDKIIKDYLYNKLMKDIAVFKNLDLVNLFSEISIEFLVGLKMGETAADRLNNFIFKYYQREFSDPNNIAEIYNNFKQKIVDLGLYKLSINKDEVAGKFNYDNYMKHDKNYYIGLLSDLKNKKLIKEVILSEKSEIENIIDEINYNRLYSSYDLHRGEFVNSSKLIQLNNDFLRTDVNVNKYLEKDISGMLKSFYKNFNSILKPECAAVKLEDTSGGDILAILAERDNREKIKEVLDQDMNIIFQEKFDDIFSTYTNDILLLEKRFKRLNDQLMDISKQNLGGLNKEYALEYIKQDIQKEIVMLKYYNRRLGMKFDIFHYLMEWKITSLKQKNISQFSDKKIVLPAYKEIFSKELFAQLSNPNKIFGDETLSVFLKLCFLYYFLEQYHNKYNQTLNVLNNFDKHAELIVDQFFNKLKDHVKKINLSFVKQNKNFPKFSGEISDISLKKNMNEILQVTENIKGLLLTNFKDLLSTFNPDFYFMKEYLHDIFLNSITELINYNNVNVKNFLIFNNFTNRLYLKDFYTIFLNNISKTVADKNYKLIEIQKKEFLNDLNVFRSDKAFLFNIFLKTCTLLKEITLVFNGTNQRVFLINDFINEKYNYFKLVHNYFNIYKDLELFLTNDNKDLVNSFNMQQSDFFYSFCLNFDKQYKELACLTDGIIKDAFSISENEAVILNEISDACLQDKISQYIRERNDIIIKIDSRYNSYYTRYSILNMFFDREEKIIDNLNFWINFINKYKKFSGLFFNLKQIVTLHSLPVFFNSLSNFKESVIDHFLNLHELLLNSINEKDNLQKEIISLDEKLNELEKKIKEDEMKEETVKQEKLKQQKIIEERTKHSLKPYISRLPNPKNLEKYKTFLNKPFTSSLNLIPPDSKSVLSITTISPKSDLNRIKSMLIEEKDAKQKRFIELEHAINNLNSMEQEIYLLIPKFYNTYFNNNINFEKLDFNELDNEFKNLKFFFNDLCNKIKVESNGDVFDYLTDDFIKELPVCFKFNYQRLAEIYKSLYIYENDKNSKNKNLDLLNYLKKNQFFINQIIDENNEKISKNPFSEKSGKIKYFYDNNIKGKLDSLNDRDYEIIDAKFNNILNEVDHIKDKDLLDVYLELIKLKDYVSEHSLNENIVEDVENILAIISNSNLFGKDDFSLTYNLKFNAFIKKIKDMGLDNRDLLLVQQKFKNLFDNIITRNSNRLKSADLDHFKMKDFFFIIENNDNPYVVDKTYFNDFAIIELKKQINPEFRRRNKVRLFNLNYKLNYKLYDLDQEDNKENQNDARLLFFFFNMLHSYKIFNIFNKHLILDYNGLFDFNLLFNYLKNYEISGLINIVYQNYLKIFSNRETTNNFSCNYRLDFFLPEAHYYSYFFDRIVFLRFDFINLFFFKSKFFKFINLNNNNVDLNSFFFLNSELKKNLLLEENIFNHKKNVFLNIKMNEIFTYSEYDKFKNDHGHQRFRSVFPYWKQSLYYDQTDFKNDKSTDENLKKNHIIKGDNNIIENINKHKKDNKINITENVNKHKKKHKKINISDIIENINKHKKRDNITENINKHKKKHKKINISDITENINKHKKDHKINIIEVEGNKHKKKKKINITENINKHKKRDDITENINKYKYKNKDKKKAGNVINNFKNIDFLEMKKLMKRIFKKDFKYIYNISQVDENNFSRFIVKSRRNLDKFFRIIHVNLGNSEEIKFVTMVIFVMTQADSLFSGNLNIPHKKNQINQVFKNFDDQFYSAYDSKNYKNKKNNTNSIDESPGLIMFAPFNYSKWYTHNPRLSYRISPDLLEIYSSNQFVELKYIVFQCFFLLKKKIYFDIFMLKSYKYKQNILYNVSLDDSLLNQNNNSFFLFLKNNIFNTVFLDFIRYFISVLNDFKYIMFFKFITNFSFSVKDNNSYYIQDYIYRNGSHNIYSNLGLCYQTLIDPLPLGLENIHFKSLNLNDHIILSSSFNQRLLFKGFDENLGRYFDFKNFKRNKEIFFNSEWIVNNKWRLYANNDIKNSLIKLYYNQTFKRGFVYDPYYIYFKNIPFIILSPYVGETMTMKSFSYNQENLFSYFIQPNIKINSNNKNIFFHLLSGLRDFKFHYLDYNIIENQNYNLRKQFVLKHDYYYYTILFLDFYLNFLFLLSLFFFKVSIIFNQLNLFDFYLLNFRSDIKQDKLFVFFFHLGFIKNITSYCWILNLKFMLFHSRYYFYYFIFFFIFVVSRTILDYFKWKRSSQEILNRFHWTDKLINRDNQWFDSITKEVIKELEEEIINIKDKNKYKFKLDRAGLEFINKYKYPYYKNEKDIDSSIKEFEERRKKNDYQKIKNKYNKRRNHKMESENEIFNKNNTEEIMAKKKKSRVIFRKIYLDRREYSFDYISNLLSIQTKLNSEKDIIPESEKNINLINQNVKLNTIKIYSKILKFGWPIIKQLIKRLLFSSKINEKNLSYNSILYLYSSFKFELINDLFAYLYVVLKVFFSFIVFKIKNLFLFNKTSFEEMPLNASMLFLNEKKHQLRVNDFIKRSFILHQIVFFYNQDNHSLNEYSLGTGLEASQLYYIIEFDNIKDNTPENAFSKFIIPRSFSHLYNKGYFVLPSTTVVPDDFDEFLRIFFKDHRKIDDHEYKKFGFATRRRLEYFKKIWHISKYLTSNNRLPYQDIYSFSGEDENYDFVSQENQTIENQNLPLDSTDNFNYLLNFKFGEKTSDDLMKSKNFIKNNLVVQSVISKFKGIKYNFKVKNFLNKKFNSKNFVLNLYFDEIEILKNNFNDSNAEVDFSSNILDKKNLNYKNKYLFVLFYIFKYFRFKNVFGFLKKFVFKSSLFLKQFMKKFRIDLDRKSFKKFRKKTSHNKSSSASYNLKYNRNLKNNRFVNIIDRKKKSNKYNYLNKKHNNTTISSLFSDSPSLPDNELYNAYVGSTNLDFPSFFKHFWVGNFYYYFFYFLLFFFSSIMFCIIFLFLIFLFKFFYFIFFYA